MSLRKPSGTYEADGPTTQEVVHQAGEPDRGAQRCSRCAFVIVDNRGISANAPYHPVGSPTVAWEGTSWGTTRLPTCSRKEGARWP